MQIPRDLVTSATKPQDRNERRVTSAHRNISLEIAVTYLLVSLLWIFATDGLVLLGFPQDWYWVSTGKGVAFVLLTTLLIYGLCRRGFRLLENSNSLLRAVVDSTTDAVYVKDREGRYTLFNEAAAKLIGKPVDDVIGQDDTNLFDPESAQRVIGWDRKVMASGQPETYEIDLWIKQVRRAYFTTKSPHRDANGKIIGVVGISRDVTERQTTDAALREARTLAERNLAQLQAVVTSLTDGVVIADMQGNLIDWNPAAMRMHGIHSLKDVLQNVSALTNRFVLSIPGGPPLPLTDWPISRLTRGERVENCELSVRMTDSGLERLVSYSGTSVNGPDGKPELIVLTLHDVTDQSRVEEALRASERRFREFADAIPQIAWVASPDGGITHLNARAFEYSGVVIDKLKGWSWESLIHPDDLPLAVADWTEAIRTGVPRPNEFRIRRSDGTYRWHLNRQVAARDSTGRIVTWYGTNTDNEELKQSSEELRRSTEMLRLVLDNIPQGVFWKDRESRYLGCNRVVSESKGLLSPEAVIGLSPADVPWITKQEAEFFAAKDREVIETGIAQYHIHETMTRQDGSKIWLDTNKIPIRDADGRITGLLGTWEDITERRRAEETLRASEETLRLFIEHVSAPVAMFDCEMRYIHASRRWFAVYQIEDEDITGKNHYDIFPNLPERWKEIYRRCLAGAVERCEEDRFCRDDGSVQWLRWEVRRWMQADDSIGGILIFSEDITERKLAQIEQQKLVRLIEHSRDFIATADLDGKISFINSGGRRMIGLRKTDDVSKLKFTEYVPPAWQDFFRNTILPTARDQGEWEGEMQLCNMQTGKLIDVFRSIFLIQDSSTGDCWFATVTRDITKRKLAELALRKSEEQLRLAIETASLGFYDWDLLTNDVYFSPRWKWQIGYLPNEITDRFEEFESRLHPDDRESLLTKLRNFLANPSPNYTAEFRLRHKDGSYRWIHTLSSLIVDESGKPIRMLGTHSDLTEQKKAASELELTRDRMAKTIETAPIAICSFALDQTGRFSMPFISSQIRNIYGLNSEDVVDDFAPAFDRVFADDRPKVLESIHESAAKLTPWRTEFRVQHPDRGIIWVEGHAIPSRQPDGKILWHGYVGDITSRKQSDDAIRENLQKLQISERRFRELADAMPQTAWTADAEGKLTHINMQAVLFTGVSNEELLASKWERLVHPEDLLRARVQWIKCVRSGTSYESEIRFRRSDGEYRWQIVRGMPIRDSSGKIREWYGTSTDVEDLKRVEKALRDRERFLSIVTRTARVGITVVNDRYEFVYANEAYGEILGLKINEVIGRQIADILPDGWPTIKSNLDRVFAGEQVDYEVSLPTLPGASTDHTYRVVSRPRLDDFGKPTSVSVIMDITEMKLTKRMMSESEKRYRRLVEVLPGAILVHDGEKILFCNPAFVWLVGANSADELVGKSPFDFVHPDFHHIIRSRMTSAQETSAAAAGMEMLAVRCDGRTVPVHVVGTSITGYGDQSYLVALSDLTDRERSVQLLRSVMESVDDAILTIDDFSIIMSANSATERMFGYSLSEILGSSIEILMPEPYRTEHTDYVANFIRTGIATVIGIGREFEGRRKDGSIFPIELTVTEFQLDGNRHFTGVIRNIAERKRMETQFQQSQKMEAIGRLAGGVAHDFNNLLTIINGYGNLMLSDMPANSSQHESVAAILDAGERAARLTQQLLAFSRKAIVETKIVDLNELVEKTTNLLRRLIEEDISLTVVLDPKLYRINAAPGQLEQILMNLIVNARDAMPDGGCLLIETRNVDFENNSRSAHTDLIPGQYVRLTIADSGHGMTEDIQNKIFEPFFTTKEVGKGTGLGLAVVHGLVKQFGGSIVVNSEVGVGTTFELLFPIVPEPVAGVVSETTRHSLEGHETVLLVEDETAVRKIAKIALETKGYKVLEASGGHEAIRLAEAFPDTIDLLLTDVVMPEMGGLKLAEAMQLQRPGIRVLYMSGYTDESVLQRGVTQGPDELVRKPFTAVGLIRKVRAMLDVRAD